MARQTRSAAIKALAVTSATRRAPTAPAPGTKATPTPAPPPTSSTAPGSGSTSSPPQHLFENALAWETWLASNHSDPVGVWLQIAKKTSPTPSVTYDEALDAALCYGWIDGQRRSLDANYFLQRFTPRRRGSMWSRRNVDKVAMLVEAGRMRGPGEKEVEAARADGRWERAYEGAGAMGTPKDFAAALAREQAAGRFWDSLGRTERYKFLWRIETTKRPETRRRKIGEFVGMLKEGRKL